jgi:hypothetical protein
MLIISTVSQTFLYHDIFSFLFCSKLSPKSLLILFIIICQPLYFLSIIRKMKTSLRSSSGESKSCYIKMLHLLQIIILHLAPSSLYSYSFPECFKFCFPYLNKGIFTLISYFCSVLRFLPVLTGRHK